MPPVVTALSFEELKSEILSMGEPSFRAGQLFQWIYQKGAKDFAEMTNLSVSLRETLSNHFQWDRVSVERFDSADGTRKFRFRLHDGESIEAVWIPEAKRKTLCISSQVGCALKCAFCVTGAVGFRRNMTADEIVEQVRYVKLTENLPISNVVFMGMGEPLLNVENVVQAIRILTAKEGLAIGKRKITVST